MRRLSLLVVAAAAAAPLFAAPAEASIYCVSPYPPLPGDQPFCTVYCAAKLDLRDPCWIQD